MSVRVFENVHDLRVTGYGTLELTPGGMLVGVRKAEHGPEGVLTVSMGEESGGMMSINQGNVIMSSGSVSGVRMSGNNVTCNGIKATFGSDKFIVTLPTTHNLVLNGKTFSVAKLMSEASIAGAMVSTPRPQTFKLKEGTVLSFIEAGEGEVKLFIHDAAMLDKEKLTVRISSKSSVTLPKQCSLRNLRVVTKNMALFEGNNARVRHVDLQSSNMSSITGVHVFVDGVAEAENRSSIGIRAIEHGIVRERRSDNATILVTVKPLAPEAAASLKRKKPATTPVASTPAIKKERTSSTTTGVKAEQSTIKQELQPDEPSKRARTME